MRIHGNTMQYCKIVEKSDEVGKKELLGTWVQPGNAKGMFFIMASTLED